MEFIKTMDMSYSYKPVLLKAFFSRCTDDGRARISDLVSFFIDFYEERKEKGLIAEKQNSIYQKGGYTKKDVERNIFSNPFKRFADMRFFRRCKDIEWVEFNPNVWRKLVYSDIHEILEVCDTKLSEYYGRDGLR